MNTRIVPSPLPPAIASAVTRGRVRRAAAAATCAALLGAGVVALPVAASGATSSAPTGVQAFAGNASAVISWTPPAAGSFAVGGYYLQYSLNGGSTWSGGRYTGALPTSFTYTRLTNGRSYVFRVRAENSTDAGAWSLKSNAVVPGASTSTTSPPTATTTPLPSPSVTTTPTATTTTVPTPTPPPTASAPPPSWWRPSVGTTFQYQLSGTVDTSVAAAVFDIDGEEATAATVATLHARGARVVCYFDAGGWESYRSDAAAFPATVLGKTMAGWPDERWLDIRQLSILLPIMEKRITACKAKGFDAVDPDVVDGYQAATGFPLTAADQLAYNRALADLAHRQGMAVGLKNDAEQVVALQPQFDFALVEECVQYGECATYSPFVTAGKPVFEVEYQGTTATFCPVTTALRFTSMKKNLSLDAWRQPCP